MGFICLISKSNAWIIDVTPDINKQLRILMEYIPDLEYPSLSGVFLTHAHIGHYIGLLYFGLEALSLTIVGYLGGYLKNIYEKVLPYIFHILWILIILLHFLVICYFRYQNIYISNLFEFLFIWIATTSYTMLFIISIQFIFPFRDASNAEIS